MEEKKVNIKSYTHARPASHERASLLFRGFAICSSPVPCCGGEERAARSSSSEGVSPHLEAGGLVGVVSVAYYLRT